MQRPENHAHPHARGKHYGNFADLSVIDLLSGTFHDAADFPMTTGFYEGASARVPQMRAGRDVSGPRARRGAAEAAAVIGYPLGDGALRPVPRDGVARHSTLGVDRGDNRAHSSRLDRMLANAMSGAAFLATALSTALVFYLCGRFLRVLRIEAPQVYAELGSPTIGRYLWSNELLMVFSNFILTAQYRARLAAFPASRAWASWLHWAHWMQILTLVWLLVSIVTS